MDKEQTAVTKRIKCFGMVQGVGFRPLICRLAKKHGIKGTVGNLGGIAEIVAYAPAHKIQDFLRELNNNEWEEYEIVHLQVENTEDSAYSDFKIVRSEANTEVSIIPPDLPICSKCAKELVEVTDRRYHNPFITCTVCGPRYTIIDSLPYDRNNTGMKDFSLCHDCQKEYTDIDDRRFHAQTLSCNACGPYLIMDEFTGDEAMKHAVQILQKGGIIAVKGIGGYHFVCSPFIEETVDNLRRLKGREEKPFAVMFESVTAIEEYCYVSQEEKNLLQSKARPIVLLYAKEKSMAESTTRGGIYCGAFLPYTALQILLLKECGPLVMTSANVSGKPIIKDDAEMLDFKSAHLSGVLYHQRRIRRAVEDSVAKIIDNKPQLLRRSRGYVPYPIFLTSSQNKLQIFAAGGDLKAAFCLYKNGSAVVSQYFGDLEEAAVMDRYKDVYGDLKGLLNIQPNLVVCDLHPNYHSALYAKSLAASVLFVQHHHAHIASVMAEHDLKGPVIGVAFDGTGYGEDGNIWGGEFLICVGAGFERTAHLSYTPILGGDSSMRDSRKTAACYLLQAELFGEITDERRDIIKAAVANNINTVLTSSMGRLFDAVASILDICHENRYEGECAVMLEKAAVSALQNEIKPEKLSFAIKQNDKILEIDASPLLQDICRLKATKDKRALALGFHYGVAQLIVLVCENIRKGKKINTVALSGGVFQNTILTELTLNFLREKGFAVYINMAVPSNDGSISLGQAYIGMLTHRSFQS